MKELKKFITLIQSISFYRRSGILKMETEYRKTTEHPWDPIVQQVAVVLDPELGSTEFFK